MALEVFGPVELSIAEATLAALVRSGECEYLKALCRHGPSPSPSTRLSPKEFGQDFCCGDFIHAKYLRF